MNVIEVQNLTKDYGSGRGVFDVSFGVGKGEVFGFLGPNGAGKSTTIRHLMGFSSPDSGQTLIFGKPTFEHYHEILNRVGYIPGEIALPAGLTGWEFIRMMQDLQKIHNAERLSQMLEMFELSDAVLKGDTKRMSLGVKRKLAVVTAFMGNPDVLILDEPTSGLDPVMQNKFIEFIHEEKRLGKTILLSSHIFSEIDSTCDRIAIIKDGKIVSEFIADDLKHASKKFYQIDFRTVKDKNSFVKGAHTIPSLEVLKDDKLNLFVSVNDEDINETMAYVLSTSTKRQTVVFTQALYLICSLLCMFSLTTITGCICLAIVGSKVVLSYGELVLLNLGAFLVLFALSGLCFLTSCWFDRSKRSMAIGGGLSIFSLVAAMLGLFGSPVIPKVVRLDALNNFNYVTIITLFDAISIIDGTLTFLWKFAILLVLGVIGYVVGSIKFTKKDLPL